MVKLVMLHATYRLVTPMFLCWADPQHRLKPIFKEGVCHG